MSDQPIRLAITGAAGRMGGRLIVLASADEQLKAAAALEAAGHPKLGTDAGAVAGVGPLGLPITADLTAPIDVLIDFSSSGATAAWLNKCLSVGASMVIGTTGLDSATEQAIARAASRIAIVRSANMSVGINVLLRVVGELARALGDDYDVEIAEQHHRFKKDAPSGTALALARAICQATGRDGSADLVHGRCGKEATRGRRQIGMHALRLGDTVGEHEVLFGSLGETIKLAHSAHTRDTFATGALRAARWLAGRKPALYSMQDVLFGPA